MAQYLCGCNWMHLLYANASFAGAGVLIMLAPMIRETPAAIEKNAVAEEMSRMMGRGLRAHYSTGRTLQGERNSPLQGWLDLEHILNATIKR